MSITLIGVDFEKGAQQITNLLLQFSASYGNNSHSDGTTADAPSGSLVVISVICDVTNSSISTVTDSVGNTYTKAVELGAVVNFYDVSFWYSILTNDLPIGGTFTSTNTALTSWSPTAVLVKGSYQTLDASASNSNTGTTVSVSTGVLSTSPEIVFGAFLSGGAMGATYTPPSNFTSVYTIAQAKTNTADFGYTVVSNTNSVTYAPSWTTSHNASAVIASFK